VTEALRSAWAEVDLDAICNNARVLVDAFAPAELCAVVKADGYGHGAVPAARAALDGGATRLAVAYVGEGVELRAAGITAPVLLLSEPQPTAMTEVVAHRLTPTVYTYEGLAAVEHEAVAHGGAPLPVHVKVDTGMNRAGIRRDEVIEFVRAVSQSPGLELEGLFTHLAVADEPTNEFTQEQGRRFEEVVRKLGDLDLLPPLLHAANSAAGILQPELRMSFVRCGAALYGLAPSDDVVLPSGIEAAMAVRARVSLVKRIGAGEGVSYGQRFVASEPTIIATVPVGYADGLPRNLSERGEVLIKGQSRPIAGNVTMDQFMVDCGNDAGVAAGYEVVILGRQGDKMITAGDIARNVGTIGYEIVCRIGPRLPRRYAGPRH